ncbi:MAG TPA: hypothetical protein DDW76_37265 [Cyanobacteria bacterium UBA11369]|nr:hypothetical protein [Cyanobacteria bacterium UBA8553]HAZ46716.1 hypothetical protein [Cyanobacteria bacterium UBA11371]HBE35559.1 hypothetical protein [Cyanobacteria bacterium UBA11368]HBE54257.1 hypothetical protein [Cyanobacteria bacterium UBA11369]
MDKKGFGEGDRFGLNVTMWVAVVFHAYAQKVPGHLFTVKVEKFLKQVNSEKSENISFCSYE